MYVRMSADQIHTAAIALEHHTQGGKKGLKSKEIWQMIFFEKTKEGKNPEFIESNTSWA